MPTNTPAVFVSYSRNDSDFALQLAKDLRAAGVTVWIDQQSIAPGQHWDTAIEEALIECTHIVPVLSPSSVKSPNVRNEIAFAFDEQKSIIPVLYKDCAVPLQLRRVQHIDFRTEYARSLDLLLESLGIAVPEQQITTPPTEPSRPVSSAEPQVETARTETAALSFESAEANALSGYIKRPLQAFIPPQAGVTLPPSGGFLTQRVERFRFENILACSSCSSQASSSEDDETGKRSVLVSTTIEGLNVLEVLTARSLR